MSAWEIGLLCAGGRFLYAKTLHAAQHWIDLSHRDPADRLLLATARTMSIPIVTRDRIMLRHAEAGHVQCIPC